MYKAKAQHADDESAPNSEGTPKGKRERDKNLRDHRQAIFYLTNYLLNYYQFTTLFTYNSGGRLAKSERKKSKEEKKKNEVDVAVRPPTLMDHQVNRRSLNSLIG